MRPEDGTLFIAIARAAIAHELGLNIPTATQAAAWLHEPGASFVTLMQSNQLRGCIGSLRPTRPLLADVQANAVAAAFRDPRFKPVTREEFERTLVEVSVLSALEPLPAADEDDAVARLRPGVDGLVFRYGHHQSTFLPQVWEHFPDPREFLIQLKHKAGLPPDFWDAQAALHRYTVAKWREQDLGAANRV